MTAIHPHRIAAAWALLLSTAWHCRIDDVRRTPLVALVDPRRPVLDERPTVLPTHL